MMCVFFSIFHTIIDPKNNYSYSRRKAKRRQDNGQQVARGRGPRTRFMNISNSEKPSGKSALQEASTQIFIFYFSKRQFSTPPHVPESFYTNKYTPKFMFRLSSMEIDEENIIFNKLELIFEVADFFCNAIYIFFNLKID